MYQKILVPLNGSDASRRGFEEAIRLARLTNGSLRLIHVLDESFALAMDAYASCSGDWLDTLREDGTKLLQDARAKAGAAGIAAEVVLNDNFNGKVAELVAAEAMNWPADLIVLGTRGRRGLRRVILGSKAENILRMASVPVLLVRSPEEGAEAKAIESACASTLA